MASSYFEITSNNNTHKFRIHFKYSRDTSGGTIISITDIETYSSEYAGVTYYLNGYINVNGSSIADFNYWSGNVNNSFIDAKYNTWSSSMTFIGDLNGFPFESAPIKERNITISVSLQSYVDNHAHDSGWQIIGEHAIELPGYMYIGNGTSLDSYIVYIGNGSSWDEYIPYIGNGTSWDICS